jgi:hypothetical protein
VISRRPKSIDDRHRRNCCTPDTHAIGGQDAVSIGGTVHRLITAFVMAVAMLATGCAGSDPLSNELLTASIAPGTGRKSVGVISAIGETFSVQKVGFTVFQNEYHQIAIDSWALDEFVAGTVARQLSARFEAKRLNTPKGSFAALEKEKSVFSPDARDYRLEIRDIVRSLAASNPKCDLYLVITRGGSMVGNTNQSVGGLGILNGGNGALFTSIRLHALFEVRVLDGRTFEILGRQRATLGGQPNILLGTVIRGPDKEVDKSWWPQEPNSVARDARMRDATRALVEQAMNVTIGELMLKN